MPMVIRHVHWGWVVLLVLVAVTMCSTPTHGRIAPILPGPPGPGWVWVPPEYKTVVERVWVPARTERVPERVWIEAVWDYRPIYDACGNFIKYGYVMVSPGRWETHWKTVTIPAHWETRSRQVLVRAGYWKWVGVTPPPPPVPLPVPVDPPVIQEPVGTPGVPSVGVEGYDTPKPEKPSPFTPLEEWPR